MNFGKNIRVVGDKVISYTTHVATLDHDNNRVVKLGYWSRTTAQHINKVARHFGYEVVEDKDFQKQEVPTEQPAQKNPFAATAMVMAVGEIMGAETIEQKVDWKLRMLKASMGDALIMPEDWDTLSPETQLERLDKIEEMLASPL